MITREETLLRKRLLHAEVVGSRMCAVCGREWALTRRQEYQEQRCCSRACANRERHAESARRYRLGAELRTLREWAAYGAISLGTLRNRMRAGQTIAEALSGPRPRRSKPAARCAHVAPHTNWPCMNGVRAKGLLCSVHGGERGPRAKSARDIAPAEAT